jgi:hypothetical protein
VHAPDGGKFSLYELRVFGKGAGSMPAAVKGVSAVRNPADGRQTTVRWVPSKGAEFYIVRLGASPDLLTQSFQVYDGQTSTTISTFNIGQSYYVAGDAVNEAGVRRAGTPVLMR